MRCLVFCCTNVIDFADAGPRWGTVCGVSRDGRHHPLSSGAPSGSIARSSGVTPALQRSSFGSWEPHEASSSQHEARVAHTAANSWRVSIEELSFDPGASVCLGVPVRFVLLETWFGECFLAVPRVVHGK